MATRAHNGRILIEGHASPAKRQLWRVVDGAVRDAMTAHPQWCPSDADHSLRLRNSIVKRVVGSVMGYAETSAWGRSGVSPAADGTAERLSSAVDASPLVSEVSGLGDAAATSPRLPAAEQRAIQ